MLKNFRSDCLICAGDKNDRRMAHEFLTSPRGWTAKSVFRRRLEMTTLSTQMLLMRVPRRTSCLRWPWGNRATHSFDLIRPEATMLIDVCEIAIACFKCDSCRTVLLRGLKTANQSWSSVNVAKYAGNTIRRKSSRLLHTQAGRNLFRQAVEDRRWSSKRSLRALMTNATVAILKG